MTDLLQDHIHAPDPYPVDDDGPQNRARIQFKEDLKVLSMEHQAALLSPDSSLPFGLQFMLDPDAAGMYTPPDDPIQFAGGGGNPLQQPIDASPFKFLGVILMAINPETLGDYQRDVEAWVSMAGIPGSKPGAAAKALATILKKVNPATVGNYGPMIDAWAAQATGSDLSGTFPILAEGLKAIRPEMMSLYGPLVDLWSMGVPVDASAAAAAAPEPMDFGGAQIGLEHIQSGSPSFLLALGSMLKGVIPDAANELDAWMTSEPELAGLAPLLHTHAPEGADAITAWEGAGATPDATAALLSALFPGAAASIGTWGQMVILSTAVGGPDALAPVQAKGDTSGDTSAGHSAAASGVKGSGSRLPHFERIQQSFGNVDVSGVQAFTGGSATKANRSMGSLAYATGNKVAFKSSPDLHTAAHEAAHIVQQRHGVSLPGGVGSVGDKYEKHADKVADRVVRGESAAPLLGGSSGGGEGSVQHTGLQLKAEEPQQGAPSPPPDAVGATAVGDVQFAGSTPPSTPKPKEGGKSDAVKAAEAESAWKDIENKANRCFDVATLTALTAALTDGKPKMQAAKHASLSTVEKIESDTRTLDYDLKDLADKEKGLYESGHASLLETTKERLESFKNIGGLSRAVAVVDRLIKDKKHLDDLKKALNDARSDLKTMGGKVAGLTKDAPVVREKFAIGEAAIKDGIKSLKGEVKYKIEGPLVHVCRLAELKEAIEQSETYIADFGKIVTAVGESDKVDEKLPARIAALKPLCTDYEALKPKLADESALVAVEAINKTIRDKLEARFTELSEFDTRARGLDVSTSDELRTALSNTKSKKEEIDKAVAQAVRVIDDTLKQIPTTDLLKVSASKLETVATANDLLVRVQDDKADMPSIVELPQAVEKAKEVDTAVKGMEEIDANLWDVVDIQEASKLVKEGQFSDLQAAVDHVKQAQGELTEAQKERRTEKGKETVTHPALTAGASMAGTGAGTALMPVGGGLAGSTAARSGTAAMLGGQTGYKDARAEGEGVGASMANALKEAGKALSTAFKPFGIAPAQAMAKINAFEQDVALKKGLVETKITEQKTALETLEADFKQFQSFKVPQALTDKLEEVKAKEEELKSVESEIKNRIRVTKPIVAAAIGLGAIGGAAMLG